MFQVLWAPCTSTCLFMMIFIRKFMRLLVAPGRQDFWSISKTRNILQFRERICCVNSDFNSSTVMPILILAMSMFFSGTCAHLRDHTKTVQLIEIILLLSPSQLQNQQKDDIQIYILELQRIMTTQSSSNDVECKGEDLDYTHLQKLTRPPRRKACRTIPTFVAAHEPRLSTTAAPVSKPMAPHPPPEGSADEARRRRFPSRKYCPLPSLAFALPEKQSKWTLVTSFLRHSAVLQYSTDLEVNENVDIGSLPHYQISRIAFTRQTSTSPFPWWRTCKVVKPILHMSDEPF